MPDDQPCYRLEAGAIPWGDYGHILMHGMSGHLGRDAAGAIQLERTAPFVPPISFPGIGDIVVTDKFRIELANSGLRGLSFKEVKLVRIVPLDWHEWDLNSPEPKKYPPGGEPEAYILKKKHYPKLASDMSPLWELVLDQGARHVSVKVGPRNWDVEFYLESGSLAGLDFFRADTTAYNYVAEKAKTWLETRAPKYVSFEPRKFRPQS